jgi:histidine triad (HIT) family protein
MTDRHPGYRDDCVFCRIAAGELPCFMLHEDDRVVAFLDINPVNPGHALVVTKRHSADLFETPDDDLQAVMPVVRRVACAVRRVLEPDGINLHQANGPGAAQSVFHFHMHVVPRRLGDGLSMNWPLRPGDKAALASVAEALRAVLAEEGV